jgi:hypothetical protein
MIPVAAFYGSSILDNFWKTSKNIGDTVYNTSRNLKYKFSPIYKKNSIVTVNFDYSHITGEDELYKGDSKIFFHADYKLDVAIILDYNDEEKNYKVMLGIGKTCFVEYGDIKSVIRYPFENEYFGRNPNCVKQFIDDKWIDVDKNKIIDETEKIYNTTYRDNIQKQIMSANLPSTYHYRLPRKNKKCEYKKKEYTPNTIVVIEPFTWQSDVYKEVVAIILEYDYTAKNYKVLSFGSSIEDVIPEENIKTYIRCPEDGEYFGRSSNRSMKFNGEKNIWESVSEDEIINNRDIVINEKWTKCRDNIQAIQNTLPQIEEEEYEGGNRSKRKTHRKRIKRKTHIKRIKRKTHRK